MNKLDSNLTGLRFAEETTPGVLPLNPIFYPLEPNSYADFGGQVSTVSRSPISVGRQRQKGAVTAVEASGGFNQDLTSTNTLRLLQGFMFADAYEKATSESIKGPGFVISAVTASAYTVVSAPLLPVGAMVHASGFSVMGNNGLKVLSTASTATSIAASGLAVEASPANGVLRQVGQQFASEAVAIAMNGNLVRLTSASFNFNDLGLIVGEWVFIGGDTNNSRFNNNVGFARISAITTTYIEFDKVSWQTPVAEVGTGKTIQLFFGTALKNENTCSTIKKRSYQFERTLGCNALAGQDSEYLVGSVPNQFTLNLEQQDKITTDMTFVSLDNEQRNSVEGLKTGTRPNMQLGKLFNTSTDVVRLMLSRVVEGEAAPDPLFAFATSATININNNVTPNTAIGKVTAFDTSAGIFEVGGQMTVYFAGIDAVKAIRENADVTFDIILAKQNKGMIFDIPLLTLGDGRLAIELNQAVTLPLENSAVENPNGYTLMVVQFEYLPNAAG